MRFFRLMNRMRAFRGTWLDPFRGNAEARLNRALLAEYEADLDFALETLSRETEAALTELLSLPEHIRGYGHVRERHAEKTRMQRDAVRAWVAGGAG